MAHLLHVPHVLSLVTAALALPALAAPTAPLAVQCLGTEQGPLLGGIPQPAIQALVTGSSKSAVAQIVTAEGTVVVSSPAQPSGPFLGGGPSTANEELLLLESRVPVAQNGPLSVRLFVGFQVWTDAARGELAITDETSGATVTHEVVCRPLRR